MRRWAGGLGIVFPIWNLLSGLVLLVLYRLEAFDERVIVDDDATPREVVLGTLMLCAVFCVCTYALEMHWALTFSVCVAYATNVSRFVEQWAATPARGGD